MDPNNKITITVCGDGGCGTCSAAEAFVSTVCKASRLMTLFADPRQELDNTETGAESMDVRVSSTFCLVPWNEPPR
jgi:hypothetical protein